ncbi:MAG: hypothetical protein ACYDC6_04410 [Acidobacteriaceae bacterium]
MSDGIFNKLGRVLSIFGVSSPDDIRRVQLSNSRHAQTRIENGESPGSSTETAIQPDENDASPIHHGALPQ